MDCSRVPLSFMDNSKVDDSTTKKKGKDNVMP